MLTQQDRDCWLEENDVMDGFNSDKTITERQILLHLKNIQKLVAEAAKVGFNPLDGSWADELFQSNQKTSAILRQHTGTHNGKSLEGE